MDYCSAADSAGEKRACDNLTDGVGDYPAMRDIRTKIKKKKKNRRRRGKSQKETTGARARALT